MPASLYSQSSSFHTYLPQHLHKYTDVLVITANMYVRLMLSALLLVQPVARVLTYPPRPFVTTGPVFTVTTVTVTAGLAAPVPENSDSPPVPELVPSVSTITVTEKPDLQPAPASPPSNGAQDAVPLPAAPPYNGEPQPNKPSVDAPQPNKPEDAEPSPAAPRPVSKQPPSLPPGSKQPPYLPPGSK